MRMSQAIRKLKTVSGAFATVQAGGEDRLTVWTGFSPNPGNLTAKTYIPVNLPVGAPLVVVLHGCTQNAAGYDHGSGWSRLADRHGFALLFPEQKRANNPNLCFNWYQPEDARRGAGEPASIAAMIDHLVRAHRLDPARIFVTGLSAGGAMASVMLATYPELFAGGAIIAGLAYGGVDNVGQAFERMGGYAHRGGTKMLGDAVRAASPHTGPWPRIAVWHGSADTIVAASNGDDVAAQWRHVHGLLPTPDRVDTVDGYPHRIWLGPDGAPLVEQYVITGMGHGTPLAPGGDEGRSGVAGAHMLDVAISSTDRIAASWGIIGKDRAVARPSPKASATPSPKPAAGPLPAAMGVQKVIEDALRSAGLMR